MFGSDVTGITLAELSLLLLFVVIITYVGGSVAGQPDLNCDELQQRVERLEKEIDELKEKHRNEIVSLERKYADCSAKLKKLKSKIPPSCIEAGIAPSYLATVVVMGKNRFMVSEQIYSFGGIKKLYNQELDDATKHGCIQSIKVSFVKSLSAPQYNAGLRKLRSIFRTNILPGR